MSQLLSAEEQKRLVDGLLAEAATARESATGAFRYQLARLFGTTFDGCSYVKDALTAGFVRAFFNSAGRNLLMEEVGTLRSRIEGIIKDTLKK